MRAPTSTHLHTPGRPTRSRPASRLAFLLRRLRTETRGVAAIEFAFILPVMFLLFVGAVEFSQAVTVDRRVMQVASSTGDLIAREKAVTTTQVAGVMEIIEYLMRPYDPAPLRVTVLDVYATAASATTTKVCWSYNHNGGAAAYSQGDIYTLPPGLIEAGGQVVVVEVRYAYDPMIFGYFLPNDLNLQRRFFLKPRQGSVDYNGLKCSSLS